MSANIKYIVGQLNKPPYNKNYNLISFDSLFPDQLLQVLNDVFAEIDPKHSLDIREEEPNQMALRMLGMLQTLKYKPPEENRSDFRAGLVAGQKYVIHPILTWLLERVDGLKKRAYLAKYLVKVDIPQEIRGDADVAELNAKVDDLIEQFKLTHREYETLKSSGFSTSELRKDINAMEEERELVTKRIERMKQKTESVPQAEAMLEAVELLRQEREKEKEMQQQESDLKTSIQLAEQRNSRLDQQLKDLRKASVGATPEGLLKKLEEEVNVNTYIVTEKLPKELKAKQKLVETLQKVASEPAMGQTEIDNINREINSLNVEINQLNEEKLREHAEEDEGDNKGGKLSFYRQNAALISRKKEQTAEKLRDVRNEAVALQEEIREKQEELNQYSGEEVLRGDDFKMYINKLKGQSSSYKIKKAELNDLRAEYGILSRTKEILSVHDAQIDSHLTALEEKEGISGFRKAQDNLVQVSMLKSEVDEKKGETLEHMSSLITELNMKIGEKKSRLAPLLKEVRPLREKMQNLTVEYNDKKSSFDSASAGLESNMTKLDREVKSLSDDILKSETQYHVNLVQKEVLSYKLDKATEEIKLYLSKDGQEQKKSQRDQLMALITEQEKQSWMLKEEQKNIKDLVQSSSKQLAMWKDIIRLIEAKTTHLEMMKSGQVTRNNEGETLVL